MNVTSDRRLERWLAALVETPGLTALRDPAEARRRGRVAREAALARYGHARFLHDWDTVLTDVVGRRLAA